MYTASNYCSLELGLWEKTVSAGSQKDTQIRGQQIPNRTVTGLGRCTHSNDS